MMTSPRLPAKLRRSHSWQNHDDYSVHGCSRLFKSAGQKHRSDQVNEHWIGRPSFGAGFNYNFTDHIMGELGAMYTAGQGQAQLNPVENYFPFLYSFFARVAYRF